VLDTTEMPEEGGGGADDCGSAAEDMAEDMGTGNPDTRLLEPWEWRRN
jgi:hypothetical protein